MSSANVIQEFLVALGFKLDEGGQKKFNTALTGNTTAAKALGKSIAATAVEFLSLAEAAKVAGEWLFSFARNTTAGFEKLYYISQRTRSSVASIQEFGFAAGQMGSDVNAATASLENLARFMRTSPGGEAVIRGLGVETRDVNGELRQTTDIMADLGNAFAHMRQANTYAYANLFGIDEKTMLALENGDFAKFQAEYAHVLTSVGLDSQRAAKSSHEFLNELRLLGAIGSAEVAKFGTVAGEWLLGVMQKAEPVLFTAAEGLRNFLNELSLIDWSKPEQGVASFWDLVVRYAKGAWDYIAPYATAVWDKISEYGKEQWGRFAYWFQTDFYPHRIKPVIDQMFADFDAGINRLEKKHPELAAVVKLVGGAQEGISAYVSPDATRGARNNNPGNLKYGKFTRGESGIMGADDKGFAIFGLPNQGLKAEADRILKYAADGTNTIAGIISAWAPASDGNNTAAYIATVAKQMGLDANASINFDREKLLAMMHAINTVENGKDVYTPEMYATGLKNVTINQTNTTTVHGTTDPRAAGAAVGQAQQSTNNQLLRNLKTRTQ